MEIYGPEASGKTTLALHIIAQAQKQGGAPYTKSRTLTEEMFYLYLTNLSINNLEI